MEAEEIEERTKITSDFNEAKFQILRQHSSWTICKSNRRNGNFLNWQWELDNIWDELEPKIRHRNEPGDQKILDQAKVIDYIIKILSKQSKEKLYNALRRKERFLKYASEELGLGGKFASGDEDDLEE